MKKEIGIAATAATLLMGLALPASADVITGKGTASDPAVLSSFGTTGSLAFPVSGLVSAPAGQMFAFDYFFEVDSAATLTGITASSSSTSGKFHTPNVSFSSFDIKGVFAGPVAVGPGPVAFYYPGATTYNFAADTVYELIVSGSVTDPMGYHNVGSFNGNLSVVSAVPLPNSVAMFGMALFGLGTAGVLRRKRVETSAV